MLVRRFAVRREPHLGAIVILDDLGHEVYRIDSCRTDRAALVMADAIIDDAMRARLVSQRETVRLFVPARDSDGPSYITMGWGEALALAVMLRAAATATERANYETRAK